MKDKWKELYYYSIPDASTLDTGKKAVILMYFSTNITTFHVLPNLKCKNEVFI